MMVFLSGCASGAGNLERAMELRAKLLGCTTCTFDAAITADYGDEVHTFSMNCTGDNDGNLQFTVTAPETIAGITGKFEGQKGMLTFDEFALEFPRLTADQITPVSGPWILMRTLLGGYLTACGPDGENVHVTINDSYEEDALQVDVWLDGENRPTTAEIYWQGRRILSIQVMNFEIL